jgi:hypothetical protein
LSILSKSGDKTRVLLSGKPDHAQFCDHDRPTENGDDSKQSENEFSCDRRVIERKKKTAAGRYDFRNEHSRFTGISNSAVLEKRYLSFRLKLDMTSYGESFCGYVGRIFATATNPRPMAMRKKEKNWPRVKGPTSVASGSRKYSTTIRKIA